MTIFEEHLWESASVSIKMLLIVRFTGNLELTLGDGTRQKNNQNNFYQTTRIYSEFPPECY